MQLETLLHHPSRVDPHTLADLMLLGGQWHLELGLQGGGLQRGGADTLPVCRVEGADGVAQDHQVPRQCHLLVEASPVGGAAVGDGIEQRLRDPHELQPGRSTSRLSENVFFCLSEFWVLLVIKRDA